MLAKEMETREVNTKTERAREGRRPSRTDEHSRRNIIKQQPAHKRSHQRLETERQPKPDRAGPGVKDGIGRHLRAQFEAFSKLGDRRSDGAHISCSQSDKWLKQVRNY